MYFISRFLIYFVLLLVSTPIVYAQSCFEKSESFKEEKDKYVGKHSYDETSERAKNTREKVSAYLNFMDIAEGDWKGTAIKFECFGSDRNPRKKFEKNVVKYNNKLFSDKSNRQKFERRTFDTKIIRSENLDISAMLPAAIPRKKQFYVILDVNEKNLVLQSRYGFRINRSISNAPRGGGTVGVYVYRESLLTYTLSEDNKKLNIKKDLYQFGVLVESEKLKLRLERKR